MKKLFITNLILAFILNMNAQNTFPANGNVGIGTIRPANKLEVQGKSSDKIILAPNDPNVAMEMRSGTSKGTPYIDFINDTIADFDARIILEGDNKLGIIANTRIQGNIKIEGNSTLVGSATLIGKTNDKLLLVPNDPNVAIEMRSGTSKGTPYIDFTNDATSDFDARIVLEGDKKLGIIGNTRIQGDAKVEGTLTVGNTFVDMENLYNTINMLQKRIAELEKKVGMQSSSGVGTKSFTASLKGNLVEIKGTGLKPNYIYYIYSVVNFTKVGYVQVTSDPQGIVVYQTYLSNLCGGLVSTWRLDISEDSLDINPTMTTSFTCP